MNATTDPAETDAAHRLRAAVEGRTPCPPVRHLLPPGDVDAAYRVQRANVEEGGRAGRRIVGRKIGLTSVAVQQQLGVDQPDFGALFADTSFPDRGSVPAGTFLQPKVEAEVAFVLSDDLTVEQPTVADLVGTIAFVVPALEIVDSRIAAWDIDIVDTVADNASAGGFVLGGPYHRLAGLDLACIQMVLRLGDEQVSEGLGRACLGNPLNAATWLAARMVQLGAPLRAGDVIMSGALGPMCNVSPGDAFTADFGPFGSVGITFAS